MVTAHCDRVVCVVEPVIRVTTGQTITLEAKGTDSSLRITFQVSNANYPMMYYFLRFFKLKTAHRITGTLNVSAYTFDDSTRAFASVRVGVTSIQSIREVDFEGNMTGFGPSDGCVPVNDDVAPLNREYMKLKFIIFKYVWENWANSNLVRTQDALKEAFSDHLESMYEDLVDANIAVTESNPVFVEQRRIRDARGGINRRRGLTQVRVPNPAVARTNLDSVHLSLSALMDEEEPFHVSVFIDPTTASSNNNNNNRRAASSRSSSTTTNNNMNLDG